MNLLDLVVRVGVEDNATSQVSSIADKAAASVSSLASKLSSAYNGVQTATGAIVGTVGTLAATGGIERALSIEGAEAKLQGLGHTGDDLAAIMDNAKAAVSGTAYGLGEAASAAGVLAAAGIEAGDGVGQMQGVLQTIGAVATVSGREFSDVSSIFGKVAANGKLTTESMLQLQDSGIPVLSMLAQHFGKTTEEMQKMVTAGEVSFQDFNAVMNENMGQAAVVAGQTFPAAVKNMRAALSKTGAEIATPVLEALRQVILAINPVLNALVPIATQLGDTISEKLAGPVKTLTEDLGGLTAKISGGGITQLLQNISPAAVGAGAALAAFSSGGIVSLLSNVPVLGSALSSLTGAFGFLGGPIGVALAALLGFGVASGSLQEAFAPVVQELGEKLPIAIQTVMGWFERLAPAFEPIVSAAMNLIAAVLPVIIDLIQGLGEGISMYVIPVIEVISPIVAELLNQLAEFLPKLEPIAEFLGVVLGAAIAAVIAVIGALIFIVNVVLGVINGFIDALPGAIESVVNFVTGVFDWFSQLPGRIWDFLCEVINNIANFVGDMANKAAEAAGNFANNLLDGLRSIPQQALEAGQAIVQGIIDGITGMINDAANAIGDVVNTIASFLPHSPAKRGAFSGRGWTPYAGRAIVQGLAEGIEDMADAPVAAMDDVMNTISGTMDAQGSVNVNSNTASGMAGTAESLSRVESLLTQLLAKDTTLYMDSTKVSSALTARTNATLAARGVA